MKKEQELNQQVGGTLQENSGTQLVEMERIEGTPFTLVTIEDKGTFVALGRNRLTDYCPTKDHAVREIEVGNWDFLLSVMYAMHHAINSDDAIIKEGLTE